MDECPFIAYCVTELNSKLFLFRDFIFWRFLFVTTIAPYKRPAKYKCSTVGSVITTVTDQRLTLRSRPMTHAHEQFHDAENTQDKLAII